MTFRVTWNLKEVWSRSVSSSKKKKKKEKKGLENLGVSTRAFMESHLE
jgi:ABC-type uncharacterized transport system substrate-binding protein